MNTSVETQTRLEHVLTHWRRMAAVVEESDLRYVRRGRYEDYTAAIRVLTAVLTRYSSIEDLLASWTQETLRGAVERSCILAPGRGALNPEVLEGAAYWSRFRQLVRGAAND